MRKEGDANATVHTGDACLLTSDVIHCISCISSPPVCQPPACLMLIIATYAARCSFLAHFILGALHAFLPQISLLVVFILYYIHMLDTVAD